MAEQPLALQRDAYGEKILSGKFDWRDERILERIKNFVKYGRLDSIANVKRQANAVAARYNKNGKKKQYKSTGQLLRSIAWRTWNESGGNLQVFHAHYLYYEKFLEIAVGRGDPFTVLPPNIPHKNWLPIPVPGKTRRARPSIPTEMRRQARRFTTYVQDSFSYSGIAMMVYAMRGDDENASRINRSLFSRGLNGRGGF